MRPSSSTDPTPKPSEVSKNTNVGVKPATNTSGNTIPQKAPSKSAAKTNSHPQLPGPSIAMSQLHKPGIAPAGHATNTPKYAKIQPAIAIKPKLLAAAGQGPTPAKSSFDPRYHPASSPSSALLSKDSNINLSKEWVLPPRPRPGRKPTGGVLSSDDERKPSAHKKHKLSKNSRAEPEKNSRQMAHSSSLSSPPPSTPRAGSTPMATSKSASSAVPTTPTNGGDYAADSRYVCTKGRPVGATRAHPVKMEKASNLSANSEPDVPPEQVAELQKTYLAKLKEQELVQNYIDILSNQIKELKFVQSGVITFDALNQPSVKAKVPAPPPSDQLDRINNVRDLDAFLAHLTTQSNVIHSVTKKFVGDSSKEGSHVQSQIKHYLDLKAGHTRPRPCLTHEAKNENSPKNVSFSEPKNESARFSSPGPYVDCETSGSAFLSEKHADNYGHKPSSFFTSGFLRPLNMNLFEQEDGIINVDIINERDPFSGSLGSIEKKRDSVESEMEGLNSSELKPPSGKTKKIGCGFCSGETPCLCFDADSVFGEK